VAGAGDRRPRLYVSAAPRETAGRFHSGPAALARRPRRW